MSLGALGSPSVVVPSRDAARHPQRLADLSRGLAPIFGSLLAAALIVARSPDAFFHPQIWAEGGTYFYANVHNLGLLHALALPQADNLGTFTTLAAWVANFFSLATVPAVMAIISLLVQVSPVGLLLSRRGEAIAPSLVARLLICVLVVYAFHSSEVDLQLVNAQWWLALDAVIVLLLSPAQSRFGHVRDGLILLASGLTGPFGFALAPIAWVRSSTGAKAVPRWQAWALTACVGIESFSLLVISKLDRHAAGVEPLHRPHLGASLGLFIKIVGGRTILGAIVGGTNGLEAPLAAQLGAVLLAVATTAYLIRRHRGAAPLLAVAFLGTYILAGALAFPAEESPAWRQFATSAVAGAPYFLIAALTVQLALLWLASDEHLHPWLRLFAGAALTVSLAISIPSQVATFQGAPPAAYRAAEAHYDRAADGTTIRVPIAPRGWHMTLVRR